MSPLHAPWLELSILLPLSGALWVRLVRNPDRARRLCLAFGLATLVCALAAWGDFTAENVRRAYDGFDLLGRLIGRHVLFVDALSAPLLPFVALLFFLTTLATLRTKARRFSFARLLTSEGLLLAMLASQEPWAIITLLAAGTIPPLVELRARGKPLRIYALHMSLYVLLIVAGQAWATFYPAPGQQQWGPAILLALGILLRSGLAPMHTWLTDLFEHASFGTALLFTTPMIGAYAATRLVLPIAPPAVLHAIAVLALVTALYAAGMSLVQREARRFFCYLFLSHSSLVFIGLATDTPMGISGALCVWLAVGMTMAGFGLTLRSVESRTGRLSLDEYHGLYEHTPGLAALFLLTGLSSIGFPGTIGFVGAELLVEGALQEHPLFAGAIALVAALNSLAVLQAYFRVFTGTRQVAAIDLRVRLPERVAVLVLTVLILGGGLFPQPGVALLYRAARQFAHEEQHLEQHEPSQIRELAGAPHISSPVPSAARNARQQRGRLAALAAE